MSSYTLKGYLITLLIRSARTILVEGPSDTTAVSRVLLEYPCTSKGNLLLVDSVAMISNTGSIGGNRDVVEFIYNEAMKSQAQLAALVDREYREFDIDLKLSDNLCCHKEIAPSMFWTIGHSLENYFFDVSYIVEVLKRIYPTIISNQLLDEISVRFPSHT